MNKLISKIIGVGLIIGLSISGVYASGLRTWNNSTDTIYEVNYPVYANTHLIDMGSDPILNYNGKTYLPLRKIGEAVGANQNLMWDTSNPNNPHVDIVTYVPSDYVQLNIFPNGDSVRQAITSSSAIRQAAIAITTNVKTKEQKAKLIYDWIINYSTYDASRPYSSPDGANILFNTGRGLCYDYASLYSVMCKEVGVATRLVGGWAIDSTNVSVNHAWNEVQLDDGHWINVDCTWGEAGQQYGWKFKTKDCETQNLYYGDRLSMYLFATFER